MTAAARFTLLALGALAAGLTGRAADPPPKPLNEKVKEVAGTAEFLRSVPKRFATLQAVDAAARTVTLLCEGDGQPLTLAVAPDAELKVMGWWGRLDQFTPGDRVWAWFKSNRSKKPLAVTMLADEVSEQDIHGKGLKVKAAADGTLALQPPAGPERKLPAGAAQVVRGQGPGALADLKAGEPVYMQTAGGRARLVLDAGAFEARRAGQKAALRERWLREGLPGTVVFLHHFSGEMDYMLDHEAMRWGRALKAGDDVTLNAASPIKAVVKQVRPWRERTELRLVVHGLDQADLSLGQRVPLKVTPPPSEVEAARLPTDLGRPRSKPERVEWFLASVYCTCGVKGDVCTGHFYSLASCNVNGCGMPNQMRKAVGELIDKGMTDQQIFEELLKKHGPDLLRPHLLP
jgi:hypothetical protein